MNIHQLKLTLEASVLPASAYIIGDRTGDEQYAIAQLPNGIWTTYYWERGQKVGLKKFPNEEAACVDFLRELKRMLGYVVIHG